MKGVWELTSVTIEAKPLNGFWLLKRLFCYFVYGAFCGFTSLGMCYCFLCIFPRGLKGWTGKNSKRKGVEENSRGVQQTIEFQRERRHRWKGGCLPPLHATNYLKHWPPSFSPHTCSISSKHGTLYATGGGNTLKIIVLYVIWMWTLSTMPLKPIILTTKYQPQKGRRFLWQKFHHWNVQKPRLLTTWDGQWRKCRVQNSLLPLDHMEFLGPTHINFSGRFAKSGQEMFCWCQRDEWLSCDF